MCEWGISERETPASVGPIFQHCNAVAEVKWDNSLENVSAEVLGECDAVVIDNLKVYVAWFGVWTRTFCGREGQQLHGGILYTNNCHFPAFVGFHSKRCGHMTGTMDHLLWVKGTHILALSRQIHSSLVECDSRVIKVPRKELQRRRSARCCGEKSMSWNGRSEPGKPVWLQRRYLSHALTWFFSPYSYSWFCPIFRCGSISLQRIITLWLLDPVMQLTQLTVEVSSERILRNLLWQCLDTNCLL